MTTGSHADLGVRLLVNVLSHRKQEVLKRVSEAESLPSDFYLFLKVTKKKFFSNYLDALREAFESADPTDFLGNETFQSYSHAKNGFSLHDVLCVPGLVREAVQHVIEMMVDRGEADARAGLAAVARLDGLIGEAQLIRAQAFAQTRDEVIRFYHAYQEEIDRFPSNLAATLDFSTLMLSSVKKCVELIGAGRCAFFTRDLLTSDLHLEASNFENVRVFGEGPVRLDEPIMNRLVHQRESVLVEGRPGDLPLMASVMNKMRSEAVLLVPLMVRDRNVGVMLLDNPERPHMFTPENVKLAERFANKVAAAMENARLHGSEQQKLKETMALLEVSRLVTSTLDIDVLLSRLVQITADVCEVGKCSVYIYLEESDRFYPTATFSLFPDSDWETSLGEGISPSDMVAEEAESLMGHHQVIISDPLLSPFIPDDKIEATSTRSVLLVPIFSRDHLLGIMVLFYPRERDDLETEDLNLVTAVAGQAAVAMENASLYENLEMSYFSTVKALARAIEVKDPYTYGHSERVTEYAMAIARRLGVTEWECRNIKYAAALHDIGKIGIARKILNKPGALSEEEFVHVKSHPLLGDSIIEPVAFLQAPRQIILHHHERYDGKGYPDGLKGEEIPLGARILAVADSFEAMMSDRPYRKALALEDATRELRINSGTQFDPRVVRASLDAIEEGEFEPASPPAGSAPRQEESSEIEPLSLD